MTYRAVACALIKAAINASRAADVASVALLMSGRGLQAMLAAGRMIVISCSC